MRKLGVGLLLSCLLALGLTGSPAGADSWTWPDRDRSRGPLSIVSVKADHGRFNKPFLTIQFDRSLDPKAMGRKDFVVVDLELDGRGKSEFWVYFVGVRGRLRTFSYVPKHDYAVEGEARFSRPSPRSIKLRVPARTHIGGHAFAVGAYSESGPECARGCWDVTPQRGYLIHDYTAPEFGAYDAPSGFWLRPEVPVEWSATDRGLGRLRHTTLRMSEAGSGVWRRVLRRGPGRQRVRVPAVEGAHMMFEVLAEDGARNVTSSGLDATRIPYDQASETAPGTFTGAWMEEDDPTAFGGTIHSSTAPADTLAFPGRGNHYCVFVQWLENQPARARLQAGDEFVDLVREPAAERFRYPYCLETAAVDQRTATLTVLAGRLAVDGYWAGIDGDWAPDGTLRDGKRSPTTMGRPRLAPAGDRRSSLRALRGPVLRGIGR